jgi:hypothetical protein
LLKDGKVNPHPFVAILQKEPQPDLVAFLEVKYQLMLIVIPRNGILNLSNFILRVRIWSYSEF